MTGPASGFFAVGRESFVRACGLGINAALAFLVLARGSNGSNTATAWSAEAAASRLAMRWTTAREAIRLLEQHQLATATRGKNTRARPRYKLELHGDLIWLPNSLVDGLPGGHPPLATIRQTQDVMVLRLLVELYSAQNLREDGGVSPLVVCCDYERQQLGQRGLYVVWGFDRIGMSVRWQPVTEPHRRQKLTEEERAAGANAGVDFFRRFNHLRRLGLVLEIPYLFDGPVGEPIHPIAEGSDVAIERAIAQSVADAARACLTEGQLAYWEDEGWPEIVVPVPAHIEQATVRIVYRLRHRPHTRLTASWWADLHASGQEFLDGYQRIALDVKANAA